MLRMGSNHANRINMSHRSPKDHVKICSFEIILCVCIYMMMVYDGYDGYDGYIYDDYLFLYIYIHMYDG